MQIKGDSKSSKVLKDKKKVLKLKPSSIGRLEKIAKRKQERKQKRVDRQTQGLYTDRSVVVVGLRFTIYRVCVFS